MPRATLELRLVTADGQPLLVVWEGKVHFRGSLYFVASTDFHSPLMIPLRI